MNERIAAESETCSIVFFYILKPLQRRVHRFSSCFFPPVARSEREPLIHLHTQATLPPTPHDFKQASTSVKFQCQNCKSTVIVPIAIHLCPPTTTTPPPLPSIAVIWQMHRNTTLLSAVPLRKHRCLHCTQGLTLLSCVRLSACLLKPWGSGVFLYRINCVKTAAFRSEPRFRRRGSF